MPRTPILKMETMDILELGLKINSFHLDKRD